MRIRRRPCLWTLLVAGVLVGLGFCAPAQDDPQVQVLVERAKAYLENPTPLFVRQHVEPLISGQTQGEIVLEVWFRDLQHIRVDRSDGVVMVCTAEDGFTVYRELPRVLLRVPPETLETLGEDRQISLRELEMIDPAVMFTVLLESPEHMTVTGEEEVSGEQCWIVDFGEETFPAWWRMLGMVPAAFDVTSVQVALGQETLVGRRARLTLTGPMEVEIRMTAPEVEQNPDIPPGTFTITPPDDALTITWDPGESLDEVKDELNHAIAGRGG